MWDKGYLQQWAHNLGIGRDPGIDLPGRGQGPAADPAVAQRARRRRRTRRRPWSAGDNVQLATGQGDLQTNPLQMAIAYATLGNGGTVVTPHVGMEIDDSAGRVVQEFDPGPQRHVHDRPDPPGRRSSKASTTQRRTAAEPPTTSSAASRSKSPARPAPRSGRPTKTSPGTRSWLPIRTRRSSPS